MDRLLELTYRAERTHFWFRGFRRFVTPWLAAAAGGRTDLRLLDCGCGTGANLALLGRHGRAFGFDLTARGLAFARAHGVTRVVRASIDAIPYPDGAFDVVTSFDVLYGLPDGVEAAAVREIARVLKPRRRRAHHRRRLRVAARRTWHVEQRSPPLHDGEPVGAAARRGLEVVRTSYTHATLFPILYVVRGWQRWRGGGQAEPSEAEISVPSAPANAVLSAALAVESWALRATNLPFGSSVICLARKPR